MQIIFNQLNKLNDKALAEKRIACKSDLNLEKFKTASEYYNNLADFIEELFASDIEIDKNLHLQLIIMKEHSLFQANECLCGYLSREHKYDTALKVAKKANYHIENLLKIIELHYNDTNDIARDFIDRGKVDWKLSSLTIKISLLQPIASKAMHENDFITALDHYKKIDDLHEINHKYVMDNAVDLVLKRTELGDYYSAKAGVANSLGATYVMKDNYQDYFTEIIEQFLKAIKYFKLAQENNPEQDKFKEGIAVVTNSIKTILSENKNKWFDYLISNNNNQLLITIMQQTDNDLYKKQKAKIELENDNLKRIIVSGGFWFGIFIGLGYFLLQLASSDISWYRFLAVIFFLPLFFTIVGAFVLKTTNSLKEENFIRLMELTLKMSFKGLNALSKKDETE